ncbi:S41 family peptidase [Paucibacter sp. DJ1R-11]|uniref:S41 family peptidase n=1 Tax=Paucibacter sp. DJ1R-11 TaxID=2893556 RepID=UPI0021E35DD5|nr:S41 family peptidase [Paucibacter sp. DJ1R-11]MCV2363614.1 S41 family peptidase [Paucibacter sp. DJ1R-11]
MSLQSIIRTRAPHRLTTHSLAPSPARPSVLSLPLEGCLLLLLTACGGGNSDESKVLVKEIRGEVIQAGHIATELQGAWRVLGEGSLVEVQGDSWVRYHQSPSFCLRERISLGQQELTGLIFRSRSVGANTATDLYLAEGAPSSMSLEKVAQIPPACKQAAPSDPASTFKAMWEFFDQDYAFFKERGIDWAKRRLALAPIAAAARNDDELQAVLEEALEGFNDHHVSLIRFDAQGEVLHYSDSARTPTLLLLNQAFLAQNEVADLDSFSAQWQQHLWTQAGLRLSERNGGDTAELLNGALQWGKLPGNVGYIALSRLSEFAEGSNGHQDVALIRAAMDRALLALADTKAMIVDIAVNDGGYDLVSAEVASSFADQRRATFSTTARRPEGRAPREWFIAPKGAKPYLKPVYLLTSDRTVSAGDTLALMMRTLPHVTQVGQATSGSMSDKLGKTLPGNFLVTLSHERSVDPQGVSYEVKGVPPKLALAVFDPKNPASLFSGHAAALDRVLAMIR